MYCRKCDDASAPPGRRQWLTLDVAQELITAKALYAALVESEYFLGISLDWEFVKEKMAGLDWVMGAALAKEKSWDIPTAPSLAKLLSQGALHKRDNINLSVNSGGERYSIDLTLSDWFDLCAGRLTEAKSRGSPEGKTLSARWKFRLGEEHALTLALGEDGHIAYAGTIEGALLQGPTPYGVDVAKIQLERALVDAKRRKEAQARVDQLSVQDVERLLTDVGHWNWGLLLVLERLHAMAAAESLDRRSSLEVDAAFEPWRSLERKLFGDPHKLLVENDGYGRGFGASLMDGPDTDLFEIAGLPRVDELSDHLWDEYNWQSLLDECASVTCIEDAEVDEMPGMSEAYFWVAVDLPEKFGRELRVAIIKAALQAGVA